MNPHHPSLSHAHQEDSKDSLIQQQVQHQDLMEQHQQQEMHQQQDDEVQNHYFYLQFDSTQYMYLASITIAPIIL